MKCDVASVLEANNQCSERFKHGDVFKLFPRKKRNGKRLAKIKILTLSNRMWVGVRER